MTRRRTRLAPARRLLLAGMGAVVGLSLGPGCGTDDGGDSGGSGGDETSSSDADTGGDGCTVVMRDTFERADADSLGNAEIPDERYVNERGTPAIRSGAYTDGGGTEQTIVRLTLPELDEGQVRVRFSGSTGDGLGFWAIFNTQPQTPWCCGTAVNVLGTGMFEVVRHGIVLVEEPIAIFDPEETYYVEFLGKGDTFDATVGKNDYVEDGGAIVSVLRDIPTEPGADGDQLALTVFPGVRPSRIEDIEIATCPVP